MAYPACSVLEYLIACGIAIHQLNPFSQEGNSNHLLNCRWLLFHIGETMKLKLFNFTATLFLYLLITTILVYSLYSSAINLISSNMITTNAIKFSCSANNYQEIVDVYSSKLREGALYDVSLEDSKIRVIKSVDQKLIPNIIKGSFFSDNDLTSKDLKAVIGKNLNNLVYESKGKKKITCFGIEYEVIGVIGYKENYELNNYIFLNHRKISDNETPIFVVDSKEKDFARMAVVKIGAYFDVDVIKEKVNNIERMHHYSAYNAVLIIFVLGLIITDLLFVLYLQKQIFFSSISVLHILGWEIYEIRSYNRKKYLKNTIFCAFIVLVIFLLLSNINRINEVLNIGETVVIYFVITGIYIIVCEISLRVLSSTWRKRNASIITLQHS